MSNDGKSYLPIDELKNVFVTQKQHYESMDKLNSRFDAVDKKLDNHLAHVAKDIASIRKDLDGIDTRKKNIIISKSSIRRDVVIVISAVLGSGALWEAIRHLIHMP